MRLFFKSRFLAFFYIIAILLTNFKGTFTLLTGNVNGYLKYVGIGEVYKRKRFSF